MNTSLDSKAYREKASFPKVNPGACQLHSSRWTDRGLLTIFNAVFCLSLALFHPSAAIASTTDDGVLLEGVYSEENTSPAPAFNGERFSRGTFRISLLKNLWGIAYQDLTAPSNSTAMYSDGEASCDGANIYIIHTENPAVLNATDANSIGTNGIYRRYAKIYTGTYPPTLEPFINNLWLAFVSSGVFTNQTGIAKPFMSTDLSMFYNPDYVCSYHWTTDSGGTAPRGIDFKSNGQWFQRDRHHNGKPGFITLDPPFDKGFTMATGRWDAETNQAGFSFPVKYHFSTFYPASFFSKSPATNNQDLLLCYTFSCEVTNVAGERHVLSPIPDQTTYVEDHRLAGKGFPTVNYQGTNHWLATNDPALADALTRARRESMEAQSLAQLGFDATATSTGISRPVTIRIVILILVISPLLYLSVKAWRQTKQSKSVLD